jgi:predicted DNA-binding WGR domain protein
MHRFYALQLWPTLFGEWALVAEWGRIGSPGKVMRQVFQTEELAQTALAKRTRAKTRRGYLRRCCPSNFIDEPNSPNS